MNNFIYQNPVKIVFGKGQIAKLPELIDADKTILMTYGGGSIKRNGVYDQVKKALAGRKLLEFGGIEPNPRYETLMKAAEVCKKENVSFLLSVGGGSVLDGTKFIALAAKYKAGDPWDILAKQASANESIPLGCILTLPATGSEMNSGFVISREATKEKLAAFNPNVYPIFSILDPETTFTLSKEQTANGIVDAYVHVMEQYMTYPVYAPLQDRQSEAILLTLIEEAPKVMENPQDYNVRASIMWAATHALNGLIACGVPQDWATHMIGHELTAFYGLDHGKTLAIVLPAILRHQLKNKEQKLLQYGKRVWNINPTKPDAAMKAIEKTEKFFRSVGMKTKLSENGIGKERFNEIADRFKKRGMRLGEHQAIGPEQVVEILNLCL